MAWPPSIADFPVFAAISEKVGERCAQSVFYCHSQWPPKEATWEFYDCQMQLPWKVRSAEEPRSPWRTHCPTIAGSSKIAIRKLVGDTLTLRLMHPIEMMRVMGWDLDHWANGPRVWSDVITPDLVTSLAGNAFSAFAFTPLFSAALGSMGAHVEGSVKCDPDAAAEDIADSSECSD